MIVRATFSFLSGLIKKISHQKLNYAATLILGAGYVVMWASQNLISALVGIILCEVCIGLWFSTSMVWRNDIIPSSHRATLLSFISTLTSLVTGIFVLGIGQMVDSLRAQTYLIAATCSVISALILYRASSLSLTQPKREG
ncbi:MAG: hypothetical protein H0Z28_05795 [Archaeoglobus sp.]|nr:hypothetical protein [Archaeoglobus sp.]